MTEMSNSRIQELAMQLLHADSESQVVRILTDAGMWQNQALWRLYGDKEGNFAQAGNQQALPEAALVEKIVNCCDARLMCECLVREINPESSEAPQSVRDAVAMFFENRRAPTDEGGSLVNWSASQRTEQSRFITIAATGDKPTRGQRTGHMCLTIVDQGEGQSPSRLPKTILSLNEKNKQRIRFVQGKFNMGGSGALRFCGTIGLQLVITRRHPDLAKRELSVDPSAGEWAVTVVRREEPSNRSGEPIHSEFTYLAPVGADRFPRKGEVLRFTADTLPLMPEHDEAYKRTISWGTALKLFEYETTVGQSNVLLPEQLMYALERLLPEIALPVRIHECRGYKGDKERSFETPIAGLVVRLEDGKGDNLEHGFPLSVQLQVDGMHMTARIYAFKEDRAKTYLRDEGVIFAINGQAHGYLPKSIFSRPKAVGLPRLRNSLLILIDCSTLSATRREDLFMSSRDRLSKKPIRFAVEREIEQLLRTNPELRRLQQQRREEDVQSKLSEEKPLEEVLGRIFNASPTLKALFLRGQRLARPFAGDAGGGGGNSGGSNPRGEKDYVGKRHPTYFRIPEIGEGKIFQRNCEEGRRCRIRFETDVENGYFDRATDQGTFELEVVDSNRAVSPPSFSLTLEDGAAYLNMALPTEAEAGDKLVLQASVQDSTLPHPFVSVITLLVVQKQQHSSGSKEHRKPKYSGGPGDSPAEQGIKLPPIVDVHENDEHWKKHEFCPSTACHVESDPVLVDGKERLEHTFYINMDNSALKTEMKYGKQDPRLMEAKFRYGNVLLGLAMLHDDEKRERINHRNGSDGVSVEDGGRPDPEITIQDTIRKVSDAVAPVLLPIIDQLSGLSEENLEELGMQGEDA